MISTSQPTTQTLSSCQTRTTRTRTTPSCRTRATSSRTAGPTLCRNPPQGPWRGQARQATPRDRHHKHQSRYPHDQSPAPTTFPALAGRAVARPPQTNPLPNPLPPPPTTRQARRPRYPQATNPSPSSQHAPSRASPPTSRSAPSARAPSLCPSRARHSTRTSRARRSRARRASTTRRASRCPGAGCM